MKGGAGADILNGGEGNDRLFGGDNTDIFQFDQIFNTDTIKDFTSDDTIEFRYREGIDDHSASSVSYSQVGNSTEVSWGEVTIIMDSYTSFTIDDFTFTMV